MALNAAPGETLHRVRIANVRIRSLSLIMNVKVVSLVETTICKRLHRSAGVV